MRSTSIRECPNCKKLKNTYYGCEVAVVPFYKEHVRKSVDLGSLVEHCYLTITETYICPNCGERIVEDYSGHLTQEDMQGIVDRIVENKK